MNKTPIPWVKNHDGTQGFKTGDAHLNAKERSILQQKIKGTYIRNLVIVDFHEVEGESFAQIGRRFGFTRVRAHQIYKRQKELEQRQKKRAWLQTLIDRWFPKS